MAGSWRRLGSTTLTSAGDTITVDGFDATEFLMVVIHAFPVSGNLDMCYLRFNNDSHNIHHCKSTLINCFNKPIS